ncbi:uncharacterized protein [Watersipora subatra]|uniref:uncharacterized protein n=1 Tax=Watersipora subatra TaxID=2589382 RepID=UPI00355C62C8
MKEISFAESWSLWFIEDIWRYFSLPIVVAAAVLFLLKDDPAPINGIYQQKGKFYYLKYLLFWLIYKLRSLRKKNSSDSGEVAGYGVSSKSSVAEMERAQMLPDERAHPMAVDAVYFCSSNADGWYLVTATARRQGGMIQVLTYLRIPELGLFELPLHPRTLAPQSEPMAFAAAGLSISVVEPMKRWKITFDGSLKHTGTKKEHRVKFNLDWTSSGPFFDFDVHMNPWVTCDSMARETWTRDWFKLLQTRHQTHHEQFGHLTGSVEVKYEDHDEAFTVELHGLRDHSYGNIREWQDLFRYALQYVHLENGTNIAVGLICMPKLLSRITMGYVISPSGKINSVSWTDFELYKWGDDGSPPSKMEFSFAAGGETYHMTCEVVCSPVFYMRDRKQDGSWDIDGVDCHSDAGHGSRVYERMCTFTVNGVKGTGISEWCYENIERHQVDSAEP